MSRRLAFLVSGHHGSELTGTAADLATMRSLLLDPQIGDAELLPDGLLTGCTTGGTLTDTLETALEAWDSANQLIFYYTGHGKTDTDGFNFAFGLPGKFKTYLFSDICDILETSNLTCAILSTTLLGG